jgi:S1-C subfamily serine protease
MRQYVWIAFAAFTFLVHPLVSFSQTVEPNLSVFKNNQNFQRSQSAVVQITSKAIEDAPSARTLGKVRQGSGVVIGSDGLILTIGYLILETEQIEIRTHQQKTYPAQVVAYDQATGFGLIKSLIPLQGIEPVKLGKTVDQKIDEMLLVVSAGESSFSGPTKLKDIRAFTGYWEYHLDSAIYTSPPVVNHSGAGLFNLQGDLIGIGSLFMQDVMPPDHPASLAGNMFVPVELLAPIFKEMLTTGMGPNSRRPWLGINAVERQGRIQIVRVSPESPAQLAGIKPGQWLLGLNGQPVESLAAFYKKLWALPIQTGNLSITIFDGRDINQIPVSVIDRSTTIKKPTGV